MKTKYMNKLIMAYCLIFGIVINAQEEIDCDFNFKEAVSYVQLSTNFKKDSIKVINLLKPCLKKNSNAQLLMARLYLKNKDKKSYKKAFKLFKKAAKQNNPSASADLGIMFKYGLGCKMNFNKARKWFKKAAELGNDEAAYSLGYLYLKGFGNIDQNYSKATKWFEKSNHPMAKYWLGVCYYYGYGVQQNIQKANDLLGTDFTNEIVSDLNSNNTNEAIEVESNELKINAGNASRIENISENNLLGKWSGLLLKYDWSGKNIEQKHPIEIEFKYDSINDSSFYYINIANQELLGQLNKIDNSILFEEMEIELPHASFNQRIPNKLKYNLLSSELTFKSIGNFDFLVGNLESFIENFNEAGAPLKFILKKTETYSNSDDELSDEILHALSEQTESFIKLYPNPFKTDLIIYYTLEEPGFVQVSVTDVNGTKNTIVQKEKEQKAGKHSYFFNGSHLEKGIYVVTVIVNNKKRTRIIVKK